MSNAKPMAAMVQISQAVRDRAGEPEAAGAVLELMGGKVPGKDAPHQATIPIFSGI